MYVCRNYTYETRERNNIEKSRGYLCEGNKVEFRSKVSRFSFSVILIYEKNGKVVEINFSQE